jgi:single-strand DNA-binding protein
MIHLNEATLMGNVGRDPEFRDLSNGGRVCNLSVATTESWKDKATGEWRDRTEWHRVVIFNEHLIGVVERSVRKGTRVFVRGAIQTRKWTDQSGTEKYSTEIVLQRFRGDLQLENKSSETSHEPEETLGDEIPF